MAQDLEQYIRNVPDFPKRGIQFKDITTLLKEPKAFRQCIDAFCQRYEPVGVQKVAGIEARGFILGSVVAYQLGAGFVPIRKPGKLPAETLRQQYALEYGTDGVEVHKDGIRQGEKVLMIDDLLATGGTMAASCELVKQLGGQIAGVAFLIELDFLNGREKLKDYDVFSLVHSD